MTLGSSERISIVTALAACITITALALSGCGATDRAPSPPVGSWRGMSAWSRTGGTATVVWTGSEMIVWGGMSCRSSCTGGRYDPESDTWRETSPAPISERVGPAAVWTGTGMLVWGGHCAGAACGDGAAYDPATDTWRLMPQGAPPRQWYASAWTGSQMLVFGGTSVDMPPDNRPPGPPVLPGASYTPSNDRWSPLPDGPQPHYGACAVWAGDRLIVWGGSDEWGAVNSGSMYAPASGTWSPMSIVGAPWRGDPRPVWSGKEMLVWGGAGCGETGLGTCGDGYAYDPARDRWRQIADAGAPSPRLHASTVWTGTEMIVWGGTARGEVLQDGGAYDPVRDEWHTLASERAPAARYAARAVWTGSEMIVWGGDSPAVDPVAWRSDGGRFQP